jgi:hypothetical protein
MITVPTFFQTDLMQAFVFVQTLLLQCKNLFSEQSVFYSMMLNTKVISRQSRKPGRSLLSGNENCNKKFILIQQQRQQWLKLSHQCDFPKLAQASKVAMK